MPRRRHHPRPRPDDARRVAYDVLRAVDERGAYANIALPSLLRDRRLEPRDAAFATELAYGTLRGLGTYDEVIGACADRPLSRVDPPLLDLLRLGAHQLLRTRVPPHAAVSETAELAFALFGEGRGAFVNAILRKVSTRDLPAWLEIVAPPVEDDPVGHLAVVYSHPRWIVNAVRDALGGDLDQTAAFLAEDNTPAQVTLMAKPGRATREELVEAGAAPAAYSPYAAHLPEGDPALVPPVREGRAAVQDEGSQLVALALANTAARGPDSAWLDMCAGPGGKAALLGGLAVQRDARLFAADRQFHRAQLVRRAAGDVAGVVVADGTVPAWPRDRFDRVLVDVPCTGLGAMRRRPELRWRRSPADVASLMPLQRALLEAAIDSARPGGLVAYATCSPHLAETRVVVDDALRDRDDAEPIDPRPALPGMSDLGEGPYVQLWPHRHGTDAMFLALLRKRAAGG